MSPRQHLPFPAPNALSAPSALPLPSHPASTSAPHSSCTPVPPASTRLPPPPPVRCHVCPVLSRRCVLAVHLSCPITSSLVPPTMLVQSTLRQHRSTRESSPHPDPMHASLLWSAAPSPTLPAPTPLITPTGMLSPRSHITDTLLVIPCISHPPSALPSDPISSTTTQPPHLIPAPVVVLHRFTCMPINAVSHSAPTTALFLSDLSAA
ncbi:hypothetical protein B0H14DRAFT_3639475 [Mycena olivaceomarginata]|nr:hypothetical protein B0H14DRAFT_3639475 [Mycena olivaceomarginata]